MTHNQFVIACSGFRALAALGLTSACLGGPLEVTDECRSADQCEPGQICVDGSCVTLCNRTTDCPNPIEACLDGQCTATEDPACRSHDDCAAAAPCPDLFICAGGECVTANTEFDWCMPGSWRTCGRCGSQRCNTECSWNPCEGEGVCTAGDTQSCGSCQSQTCHVDCSWGPCTGDSICTPDTEEPCGRCGTHTCSASCEWGTCEGEGVCTPNETESCALCQSRVCTSECQWGSCEGTSICTPGDSQGCGKCGVQSCNSTCDWDSCGDEGICVPDTTQPCGNCGEQTCTGSCTWGVCEREGCEPDSTRSCGAGGTQTCSSACTWCNCLRSYENCNGTPGQWDGCRGNGCAVCAELVEAYPCYFDNHTDCQPNTGCAGAYFQCNAKCPAPTTEDECVCAGSGDWNGCQGDGCSVCAELVEDYACYFINRPGCTPVAACSGAASPCNALCPTPTAEDRGS